MVAKLSSNTQNTHQLMKVCFQQCTNFEQALWLHHAVCSPSLQRIPCKDSTIYSKLLMHALSLFCKLPSQSCTHSFYNSRSKIPRHAPASEIHTLNPRPSNLVPNFAGCLGRIDAGSLKLEAVRYDRGTCKYLVRTCITDSPVTHLTAPSVHGAPK